MNALGGAGMEFPKATERLLSLLAAPTDEAVLAVTLHQLTEEDWDAVLEEARQRGVALLLYDRLRVAEIKELVPVHLLERLRETYLAATARNMVMLHHAKGILGALKAQGIETIVLKGLYLIEHVYPAIGLRTFGDLDLMIRRGRLADALELMQGLGYTLSTWYDAEEVNTDIKHLPPLEKADAPAIELHWTILEEDEPFTIDAEGLWRRAEPVTAAGVGALALDLEDLVLHLSMHFTYQHRLRAGLRNVYDIAAVLQQHEGRVDWQKLVRTAREWGAERVTWLTLCMLAELTEVKAPSEVMEKLVPKAPPDEMVARALEQVLPAGQTGVALTPDLAELPDAGLFARLKLVWRRVFIPRRVLAREYNLDPGSLKIYGYYVVRLCDLWRRYARSGWRLVTGDESALAGANAEQENLRLREWMGGTGSA